MSVTIFYRSLTSISMPLHVQNHKGILTISVTLTPSPRFSRSHGFSERRRARLTAIPCRRPCWVLPRAELWGIRHFTCALQVGRLRKSDQIAPAQSAVTDTLKYREARASCDSSESFAKPGPGCRVSLPLLTTILAAAAMAGKNWSASGQALASWLALARLWLWPHCLIAAHCAALRGALRLAATVPARESADARWLLAASAVRCMRLKCSQHIFLKEMGRGTLRLLPSKYCGLPTVP